MADQWVSLPVSCTGGLVLDIDTLIQGTQFSGTARILQNFEPDIKGGYRRISGFTKYSTTTLPGSGPILGVKVGMNGIFACRLNGTDNAIYFGTGGVWTKLNSTARTGGVLRARFTSYSLISSTIIQCDGVNFAWKWNGSSETIINGAGAPTNPKYAKLFKGRLALAGYGTGNLLALSAPNDDVDFDGTAGALEFNVGDTIVGLESFRDTLVIFCSGSIKRLVGSTSADFKIESVTEDIGCLSGDTIQELAGDLIYLSTTGIRSYAATERIGDIDISLVSRPIQPLLRGIISAGLSENNYSSCLVRTKSQYRLFINNPSTSIVDNIGILGRVQDAPTAPKGQFEWATIVGFKPYCSDSSYISSGELVVFGHTTNGYVYRLESGNTFDGVNIFAVYRTPDLTFNDATLRKVFQKIFISTELEGNFSSSVQLLLDKEEGSIIQPSIIPIAQIGAVTLYGTGEYGTSTYGAFIFPMFKRNLIGSGFYGAFQFICNDDSAPFRIESFQVTFGQKGRR
jgi:hypothetical protein